LFKIGKPIRERRGAFSTLFAIIDSAALFVVYAVIIAVLPVAALALASHSV
jgi:hypothetical protein